MIKASLIVIPIVTDNTINAENVGRNGLLDLHQFRYYIKKSYERNKMTHVRVVSQIDFCVSCALMIRYEGRVYMSHGR